MNSHHRGEGSHALAALRSLFQLGRRWSGACLKSRLAILSLVLGALSLGSTPASAQSPDLSISNLAIGSIVANQNGTWTIPVSFTVTNSGTVPAQPGWYDRCWLSGDATLSTNDVEMGNLSRNTQGRAEGTAQCAGVG